MGGSPFYRTSLFDPFFFRPASPPRPRPRSRSVVSIPVSNPSSPAPAPSTPAPNPSAAATTIQSHYRGFAIRRRTPLLHLRTIASVQRQLDLLHSDLQREAFASSLRGSEKERFKFTESIMALLLRLDAIEGVIPEIRSRRKHITRKVIQLQEAIDGMFKETEQEAELNSKVGEALDADNKEADTASGSAVDRMIDEQEPALNPNVGEASDTDDKNADIASGSAVDRIIEEGQGDGPNSHPLSMDPVNLEKAFSSNDRLADDGSNASNVKMDAMLQDTVQEKMLTTPSAEFSNADGNNSEEMRRSFQQECSARVMNSLNIENFDTEKVIDDDCSIQDNTGGNVQKGCSFSAIRENAENPDVKERTVYLCAAGRHLEECSNCCAIENSVASTNCHHCPTDCGTVDNSTEEKSESLETTDSVDVEMLCSNQAIADTRNSSPLPEERHTDKIERPKGSQCHIGNDEMKLSKVEACDEQALSSAISTQDVESDSASKVVDATLIASLPPNSSPKGKKTLVSDRELLEQLSEDSKHMKVLLTKLYIHSRVQNKTIDSLNKRVEKLEHNLHREKLKNSKQTHDKRIRRKDKLRRGKYGLSHDGDCQLCDTLPYNTATENCADWF